MWPLSGSTAVSRSFDPPATRYGPGHRGADLPGRPGQPVRAAGAGRVSYAGLLAGRGVVVVVHGDLRTTYEPVTASVRVGQQVAAGAVLGQLTAGHPGCPGTCLHWGLRRGEVYVDPVQLVHRGPSRLLPLPAPAGATRPARAAALAPHLASIRPEPAPRPTEELAFGLRATDAAWGGTALAALVAGLGLLLRPRRPPNGPAAPALAATFAAGDPPPSGLVDLASERQRRRPEVA